MTPVVRLFWLVALVLLPLSITLLLYTTSGSITLYALMDHPALFALCVIGLAYTLLGLYELYFSNSNLRRNYPVIANFRYLLEHFRPEIQQYFIANNVEERPFSRESRNLIYQRAKNLNDTLPFGTEQDIFAEGYRGLYHSFKVVTVDEKELRVSFGGPQCKQPYSASRLNISALSFGALSSTAISALNKGAALGEFAHNTGEGSISSYHQSYGGDLIWQIGTGYFGCRHADGRFNEQAFAERASLVQVKMIEIKLSQGAKPSHGGVLPGAKVTEEIARIRLVEAGKTVLSPPSHPEFDSPPGLLQFLARLRELSGGKPIGFKLCLGRKSEFIAIVKAMLKTGILPDFITIDGAEGGTGAAPVEFSNRLGVPCLEATYYIDQVLTGVDLRRHIRLTSAGLTASAFNILEKIALGADTVNAGRSMMMALGCIQAKSCNTNHCPTGIATQDPHRSRAVDVEDKALRVYNYHRRTLHAAAELLGAMGYQDPGELKPADLYSRSASGLQNYDQNIPELRVGQLLGDDIPERYLQDWKVARAEHW